MCVCACVCVCLRLCASVYVCVCVGGGAPAFNLPVCLVVGMLALSVYLFIVTRVTRVCLSACVAQSHGAASLICVIIYLHLSLKGFLFLFSYFIVSRGKFGSPYLDKAQ